MSWMYQLKKEDAMEKAREDVKRENPEFSLDELEQIFGTADPKILFYRDYCNDMNASK